jgi:hypothetical protein
MLSGYLHLMTPEATKRVGVQSCGIGMSQLATAGNSCALGRRCVR